MIGILFRRQTSIFAFFLQRNDGYVWPSSILKISIYLRGMVSSIHGIEMDMDLEYKMFTQGKELNMTEHEEMY